MLHSMRRNAFWGGVLRVGLILLALGIPVWLYLTYLSPIVKQVESTVSTATGTKVQITDQFAEWFKAWEEFKQRFGAASSTPNQ